MIMSDLFINYDGDIDDIAEKISEALEINLTKKISDGKEKYHFYFMNIEFILYGDHELEDEQDEYGQDIKFSEYEYTLSMIKLRAGEKYKTYNEVYNQMGRFLTEKLAYDLGARTMLVENLSKVVFSAVPAVART